ncbi:MAG: hypothetical protein FD164_339, partial [Nitrospirae bacterium]
IFGRLPQQMGVLEVTVQRSLPGAAVNRSMVVGINPLLKSPVQVFEAHPRTQASQQLHPHGPEESFDLAAPLWLIWL